MGFLHFSNLIQAFLKVGFSDKYIADENWLLEFTNYFFIAPRNTQMMEC